MSKKLKKLNHFLKCDYKLLNEFLVYKSSSKIGILQDWYEIVSFLNFLKERNIVIKDMIDIGFGIGGLLYLWQQCFPDSYKIEIDDFKGPHKFCKKKQRGIEVLKEDTNMDKLFFLKGRSGDKKVIEDCKKEIKRKNLKINFLFIDGGHNYGVVKKDYEIYSQFVEKEGIIVLHDANAHGKLYKGVNKFWKEIRSTHKKNFIIENTKVTKNKYYGIGILIKE